MQHTHQPSSQRHHASAAVQAATQGARSARVKSHAAWAAVLVCGACAYAASSAAHGAEANAVAPPLVRTTVFQDAWVYPTVTVAAQVQARNTAQVAAQVGGVVQSWRADTGASVRRGDVLAQLDPQDLSLALAQAKAQQQAAAAQMALSEQQLVRAQGLVAKGFLSAQALQQQETQHAVNVAQLASASAALQTAQRALSKTRITAPFNASVLQRMAQVGDTVAPGTPLFALVDTSKPEVAANLSPAQAISLKRASTGTWRAKDTGQDYAVEVLRIGTSLDPQTRSQVARLRFVASDPMPLPGSAGELMWTDPQTHLPTHVLVRRGGQVGYFTVANNTAQFVAVARAQEGRPSPITLDGQTPIVTMGQALLQDGQPVQVSP